MIELKLLRKIRVFFWSLYQSIKSRIGKSHCLLNLIENLSFKGKKNFSPSKFTITKTKIITIISKKTTAHVERPPPSHCRRCDTTEERERNVEIMRKAFTTRELLSPRSTLDR